jgi:hypothetical protein
MVVGFAAASGRSKNTPLGGIQSGFEAQKS